jgi:hypothetical protein
MFIDMSRRSAPKPACISALTDRATERAAASAGHSCWSGKRSLTYSQIASESHTLMSPSCSAGTRPEGDQAASCAAESGRYSGMRTSSKGMPAWRSSSQGRMDQDE